MKTGVELIAQERQKQIEKHGFTSEHHADHPEWYDKGQLIYAAETMLYYELEVGDFDEPENWDKDWWNRLVLKPWWERVVISGALIASEIDRIQELERREDTP